MTAFVILFAALVVFSAVVNVSVALRSTATGSDGFARNRNPSQATTILEDS